MSLRTLVLCDDPWHPAADVRHGLSALEGDGFSLEWMSDVSRWTTARLEMFPLVILAKANASSPDDRTPWLTPENGVELAGHVRAGAGLLSVHGGAAGTAGLPWLGDVLGGVFQGHPDLCPMVVNPAPDHPLTRGVRPFAVSDEQYVMALTDPGCDVFLQSCSGHGSQPAGWTRREGRGRVCVLTPGHAADVWSNSEFQKLVTNALKWMKQ